MNFQKLLLLTILAIPLQMLGEDIIVFHNGDIIRSKVVEIGQNEVKYKKASNLEGPVYSINKSDILSITFENGEIEKFEKISNEVQTNNVYKDGKILTIKPNDTNKELINQYNYQYPTVKGKSESKKNKIVKDALIYWGFGDESILSTDDIEVRFKRTTDPDDSEDYMYLDREIIISLYNKTKGVIYVDLTNTFKVDHYDGKDKGFTWYDSSVIGTNNSSGGGASLGLGAVTSALGVGGVVGTIANGIGIGGGSSGSANQTKQMERCIAIPPMSEVELPPHMSVSGKEIELHYQDFNINGGPKLKDKLSINKHELRKFTFDDTLFRKDFYITFSKDPNFNTYGTLPIYLYVRAIYGDHPWLNMIDMKSDSNYLFENPSKLLIGTISMRK